MSVGHIRFATPDTSAAQWQKHVPEVGLAVLFHVEGVISEGRDVQITPAWEQLS